MPRPSRGLALAAAKRSLTLILKDVVNIGIIIIYIIYYKVAYLSLANSKLSEDILNISCYINA